MITAQPVSAINHFEKTTVLKPATYGLAWESFKQWHSKKFYPLNEKRFLNSDFENQQGYLISFLRSKGIDLCVYWQAKNNTWIACIKSMEVDYNQDYDTALMAAITEGFRMTEEHLAATKLVNSFSRATA